MFDYKCLVSTATLGQHQRHWKLKLGDQVARPDCQYLSLEQGKFACWWLEHPKGLPPVHHKHYLYWLSINPSGHIHYQKGNEDAPSEPLPEKVFDSPVRCLSANRDYADPIHIRNLAREFPVSSVVRSSSLDTSSAMKFSPVYNEWEGEKKDYILIFWQIMLSQRVYIFPDNSGAKITFVSCSDERIR